MINAQLKYTSFGILTIFIKLIQTTPSDVEAFDLFLPHFTITLEPLHRVESTRGNYRFCTKHSSTIFCTEGPNDILKNT